MNIVDVMIHIHPELSAEQRARIEEVLGNNDNVVSVHFSPQHTRELTVAYNPEALHATDLLEMVRQWDKDATLIGL
ncbi:MAG TPA: ATP-binding protein [Chromatiales bacterium]|nr:ATP-binding protein [Chromatiales bacterium]